MTVTEFLAEALEAEYTHAHSMVTDNAAINHLTRDRFISQHLGDLKELVAEFVADRFHI
ncbi:MAG: hypothetical protein VXX91_07815 [Planctomycetota bacterium]|nr:hypothetical protein [Planctomycetota bacterium]